MGYPEGTGPEFHVVYADEKAQVLSYHHPKFMNGILIVTEETCAPYWARGQVTTSGT